MFFDDAYGLMRVLIVGTLAYAALVILLRLSGNRTLSKMNAFDFIVTVALGSTLATILLTDRVALLEGIVAFVVLIGLQYLVTSLSVRSSRFSDLVKGGPILLYYDGRHLQPQMRQARVVEAEILAAVRAQGIPSLHQVQAVVLETDGSFTVITGSARDASTLGNIER